MSESSAKTVDVLIVGAGIGGLLLARELRIRGWRVLVAADPDRPPTSRIAAGLINPVMGRRCSLAWQAAIALPLAAETYRALAQESSLLLFRALPIVRVFADADDRAGWEAHVNEITAAGFAARAMEQPPAGLRNHGCGAVTIAGGGVVDAPALIDWLRDKLRHDGWLIETTCRADDLEVSRHGAVWKSREVSSPVVVFAGGAAGIDHPWLRTMRLRPVKGELLLIKANPPAAEFAAVGGHYLAPDSAGRWVVGASQARGDAGLEPTPAGRAELEEALRSMLDRDYTIMDHRAGVRVMTPDMRPILGSVAPDSCVHVLQGFGSRGFSLAPWCAQLLAEHLVAGAPLPPDLAAQRLLVEPAPHHRWNAVEVAHREAQRFVVPGDAAIDLTVGNGGDTQWLAQTLGATGTVVGFDIQSGALAAAQRRLNGIPTGSNVRLIHASHDQVRAFVPEAFPGRVALALANLGYWPGSDSQVVTHPATTLPAFNATLELLRPSGALVVVIYTGHAGGVEERSAIEAWTQELSPAAFEIKWLLHPGGAPRAPRVLVVSKRSH